MKSQTLLIFAIAGISFSGLCGGIVLGQSLQKIQNKPLIVEKFDKAQQVAHGLAACEGDAVGGRMWAMALNKNREVSDCCVRLVSEPIRSGGGKFKVTATINVSELQGNALTYLSVGGIKSSIDQWIDGDVRRIHEPGLYELATPSMSMTANDPYSAEIAICVRGAIPMGRTLTDDWALPWHGTVRYRNKGCTNCSVALAATAGKVKIELE